MFNKYKRVCKKVLNMAASEGVDLEWAIVKISQGEDIKILKKKYSARIVDQAQKAYRHISQKLGKNVKIKHSDEEGIYAKPEPKTDIIAIVGRKKYYISVKMEGGIQLASGQGASTAELFRETGKQVFSGNKIKLAEINSIAKVLEQMPTRLLAPQNLERIVEEANPKVLKEFVKSGKIIKEKNAEAWLREVKPKLIMDVKKFIEANPMFYSEMIREALTGKNTLASYPGAPADYILSPAGFYKIDDAYVQKVKSKVKLDIRAKSRSGITSIAFRIETLGSL